MNVCQTRNECMLNAWMNILLILTNILCRNAVVLVLVVVVAVVFSFDFNLNKYLEILQIFERFCVFLFLFLLKKFLSKIFQNLVKGKVFGKAY